MAKKFGEWEKGDGLRDVFGASPNILLQYNRVSLSPQTIFDDYGFTNMWTSENLTISGTDTTAHDYNTSTPLDLVNPAAANQPTYNESSAAFNSKPSLTFDGSSDYLYKATSDWRGSDSSGIKVGVFKVISGTNVNFLCSADEATNQNYIYDLINTNSARLVTRDSGTVNSVRGGTVINDGNGHVLMEGSKGSAFVINIDANDETLVVISGSDNGAWMDVINNRDSITIGALIYTSAIYANIEWVMSGYLPYTDIATMNLLAEDLKTYYGIS